MDNLCHSLAGLACGEAGLKQRTALGNATLVVASNLPDLDALVFLTDTPSVAFRRGWTHGIFAQALLPALLAAGVVAIDRVVAARRGREPQVRPGAILLLSYVGLLLHVFMDFLNTYGIRLLKPISERWFYGDAVFIIDPWLWLLLGGGVAWARHRRQVMPARIALGAGAIYVVGMLWLAGESRAAVLDAWTMARGEAPRAAMVGPAPVNPLRKAIILDGGDHYQTGTFTLFPRSVRFAADVIPKNDRLPEVARARQDPHLRAVLTWARFPYYEVTAAPEGAIVTLRDVRFGDRVGVARVVLPR
jgi:inner membrane protein